MRIGRGHDVTVTMLRYLEHVLADGGRPKVQWNHFLCPPTITFVECSTKEGAPSVFMLLGPGSNFK